MINPGNAEKAAIRLAELSREIDDLERGRASLLDRLDKAREVLQMAERRTASMRASLDMMCDHITNVAMTLTELRAIEEEMNDVGLGLADNEKEAAGLLFETEGFKESLDESEEELERLSAILIEGKAGRSRGH